MSRFGAVSLLALALVMSACSESDTPSAPVQEQELRLELDESAAATTDEESPAVRADAVQSGSGGKGKMERMSRVMPQVVSCVSNAWHQLCTDIRSGRLRAADGDAIARRSLNRTRGQLRINGALVATTNSFGPVFPGDEIFARYRSLNIRLFAGDRICHQWQGGASPQVCGVIR